MIMSGAACVIIIGGPNWWAAGGLTGMVKSWGTAIGALFLTGCATIGIGWSACDDPEGLCKIQQETNAGFAQLDERARVRFMCGGEFIPGCDDPNLILLEPMEAGSGKPARTYVIIEAGK